MGLRVRGIDGIGARLENEARRASEGARFALKRGAENIRDLAKEYCPVDEENLEDSIMAEPRREGINRRYVYDVFVDLSHKGTRAQTVEKYANFIHDGNYKLGKKSEEKAALSGKYVGRKFLEKAFEELKDDIAKDVLANISKRIGK